jgi:uncharacterized protein YodC (DUF2158 family)
MTRRVMMVLASAALAGSLLTSDAQAHGGVGHGGGVRAGHPGGFGEVHRVARVGGFGGGYTLGIPRGAVGYVAAPRYGMETGYGTGIRHGKGIFRGRFLALAASAYVQTVASDSSTDISVPGPAQGSAQDPPIGGPSPETETVGMAPASSASAPLNTQNQTVPAFRSGSLVRLRSGGPLMTVKGIKGDQVECFWTDLNGQINADSFPLDVLQAQ